LELSEKRKKQEKKTGIRYVLYVETILIILRKRKEALKNTSKRDITHGLIYPI
jgi:hypothetical protein